MPRPRHVALACSGLIIAAAAVAQGQEIVIRGQAIPHGHEAVQERVKIADLNLATAVGQTELEKRVTFAVNRICGNHAGNVPQHERQDAAACRKFAWGNARPQMDSAIAAAKAK